MMATHYGLQLCGYVERRGNMCSFLSKKNRVEHSSNSLISYVIALCRDNISRLQLMGNLDLWDST